MGKTPNIQEEIRSIISKLGVSPASVYSITIITNVRKSPMADIVLYCYDLKNGGPYFDESGDKLVELPPKHLEISVFSRDDEDA